MHVRYPVWLRFAERPGAGVFAILFVVESAARASLSTVITLQALAILQEPRDVSLMFSVVGLAGLAASFLIPGLVRIVGRRWVYSLGAGLLILAPLLFLTLVLAGLVSGMLLRVFGVACLSITTSLYIMQYINKRDLTRAEPLRLQASAAAWTIGPAFGVVLYESLGPAWAYGFSAACAAALLVVFWIFRLSDNPAIQAATRPPPSPAKSIGRFLAQPRLRLAWLITFGRSSWWVFFFIYAPLYMVEAGWGATKGALLVSAGNAMLFLTPIFGNLGARFGLRPVLCGAFLAAGGATFLAGIFFGSPIAVSVFLVLGALSCVALDAVGNIPFLRSVHPYERPQMTTVFRTYIDASELLPPAFFALLLSYLDLQAVFLAAGLAMVAFAFWPRYLPRRM